MATPLPTKKISARMDKFIAERTLTAAQKDTILASLGVVIGTDAGEIPTLGDGGRFAESQIPNTSAGWNYVQDTQPESPRNKDFWYDTSSGQNFIHLIPEGEETGFWVEMVGVPGSPIVPLRTVATATGDLATEDLNGYVRCTYDAGDNVTKVLTVPAPGGSFVPVEGGLYTVRNAGSGDLTIDAGSIAVTINADAGAEVIQQDTTGQLYCVSITETTFEFDLL